MWQLSSTSEWQRGHLSLEMSLLYLRLEKWGIKSHEIFQIIIVIFVGSCKFQSFL
ncbi:hypothetical protein F383_15588 [Gossypium arboreum]|uniref:Uncharacterized protein n=1 Tax=Gossypium arboreum TaxID=29729 RepID=A0A0B0PW96_GOSAR|nr:hypothetical protein F383_11701 [Gossypium arboreum]KHG27686.1 hypothetical protein F383_15588 [Gossypium arboreum]